MSGETVLVIDDSPTILKVVQLVLTKAGYKVETAADGEEGLRAAQARKPHLILLDFVMPRMNGYQVCRALGEDPTLAQVPVVLMSAKGDQVGERFVKVMGIVDYITKPFSPEAITAVVQHTVAKYALPRTAERPLLLPTTDELPEPAPPMTAEERAQALAARLEALRSGVAQSVAARVAGLFALASAARAATGPGARRDDNTGAIPTDAGAIADAARGALDDATLLELLADIAPGLGLAEASEAVLEGDLRVVPLAEVLQLLHVQSQSGVLQIIRTGATVDLFFRQGKIDLAAARGVAEEFLLGRFILDAELMNRTDLEAFLKARTPGTRLIGSQLVKLGYISEIELRQAITRQTCELIYEILRWNVGRFAFRATRDLPASAVDASLGLEVEGILMEGFRRVDEWHLIEREVDDFDVIFLRNEDQFAQLGRGRLTREELTVLELVNGKNTVKEVIRLSRMGSFEVSKQLYRLLSIKLIRRRVMPVAV
ncbi:MAG: response regulator [Myxococcales bacterium]|nr:response regulator [Myxococcales bacterium]